jgi:hypothetical protein
LSAQDRALHFSIFKSELLLCLAKNRERYLGEREFEKERQFAALHAPICMKIHAKTWQFNCLAMTKERSYAHGGGVGGA